MAHADWRAREVDIVALADPTRRAILARLREGDASVTQLAAPFAISQPAVSKHLKILERAGLVARSRSATARLSHLKAAPLKEATRWLAASRQYWDSSLDRLVETATGQGGPGRWRNAGTGRA